MNPAPNRPLSERYAEDLARFAQDLQQSHIWYLLPEGGADPAQAAELLDSQSGMIYPNQLGAFLAKHPFLQVMAADGAYLATLHSATRLLWSNQISDQHCSLENGQKIVAQARQAGLEGWRLPTPDQLKQFAQAEHNPFRRNQAYRLITKNGGTSNQWLTTGGQLNIDDGYFGVSATFSGFIFACHPLWQGRDEGELLLDLIERGWWLSSPGGGSFKPPQPDRRWQGQDAEGVFAGLAQEGLCLYPAARDENAPSPLCPRQYEACHFMHTLADIDYTPCRLPPLEGARLTDPHQGVWELWGKPADFLAKFHVVARDPGLDVKEQAVAIDFGTSSTVVAKDTASGGRELLRIGVRDFYEDVQPLHFENPTVLECLDFSAFAKAWNARAYRPALDWNWMRAAHEAQTSFRDNPGDPAILASILPRLKQWALRAAHERIRLTDRRGREITLAAHAERNPVRGQPLAVSPEDPFDPIELYAWYLGMAINWRGHGIHLKYFMSFPVKYPREVKDRILASFRRGLQRSLPQTLIDHHPDVLNRFEVKELASEPLAYAAAALFHLGIPPTEAAVPYAVFDFGGGTTDFDFGLFRAARPDEEDRGYEQVFEHLASGGDNFLGGENLLEHLVYQVLIDNLEVLRKQRIQFTKPLNADPFSGSEAFLAPTQAAQTNSVMVAARLRPFFEGEQASLPSEQIKLDLLDANGKKQACELVLDARKLDALLAQRIEAGVEAFFAELARLRPDWPADAPIHILLAGNGSRSRHIKALFDPEGAFWKEKLPQILGEPLPELIVHPPLPVDEQNRYAPTAKTGVALGLLRLKPGEYTLVIDHIRHQHEGQAPFAWFVGRMRRGQFAPVLEPTAAYGEWAELGALQQGVFNLFASQSPRARSGLKEGDAELRKHRLEFPTAPQEARVFARPVDPNTVELAAALDQAHLTDSPSVRLRLE